VPSCPGLVPLGSGPCRRSPRGSFANRLHQGKQSDKNALLKPRSLPASIAVGTLSGFDPRSEAGSTCVSVVRGRARQASVANCDDPEGDDGPTESLELQFVHWLGHDATLDGRVGSLAEQDLAGSSRIAEPGG